MEVGAALDLIRRAIESGHPAAGYLLVGDAEVAEELVSGVLDCLFPPPAEQSGEPPRPDVVRLVPEGAKRIIKVESMRERLIAPMSLGSFSGGWKVGIIEAADRMEAPSANAFLKSLEEPTPRTMYLLTTDQPETILPTIVSRTQRVNLRLGGDRLDDEQLSVVRNAFLHRNPTALSAQFERAKKDCEPVDFQRFRKQVYAALMELARPMLTDSKVPRYLAYRNLEAVEEAYRMGESQINDTAILSYLFDRLTLP